MDKKDIIIHKDNYKQAIEIVNVDVDDINTLYNVLKKYKIKIGIKKD
jgi:hypothetical protein